MPIKKLFLPTESVNPDRVLLKLPIPTHIKSRFENDMMLGSDYLYEFLRIYNDDLLKNATGKISLSVPVLGQVVMTDKKNQLNLEVGGYYSILNSGYADTGMDEDYYYITVNLGVLGYKYDKSQGEEIFEIYKTNQVFLNLVEENNKFAKLNEEIKNR